MSNYDQSWNTISEIITDHFYLTGLKGAKSIKHILFIKIDIIVNILEYDPFQYDKPK
jgi:hypothetical protein